MAVRPQKAHLFQSRYEFSELLHPSRRVRAYRRLHDNKHFAVKTMSIHKKPLEKIQNEVKICRKLNHRNVIQMVEYYADEAAHIHHLVFEMASGGKLSVDIAATGSYSEIESSHCLEQILQGVNFIHQNGIAHCDLRPENILLTGTKNDTVLKIADFSIARRWDKKRIFIFSAGIHSLHCFMAPEVVLVHYCSDVVDVWACGVILYVLLFGKLPFESDDGSLLLNQMMEQEYTCSPLRDNKCLSDDGKHLMQELLNPRQEDRMSAEDALKHPFLLNQRGVSSRFNCRDESGEPTEHTPDNNKGCRQHGSDSGRQNRRNEITEPTEKKPDQDRK